MSKVIRLNDRVISAIEEYREYLRFKNESLNDVEEKINFMLEDLDENDIILNAIVYALNN